MKYLIGNGNISLTVSLSVLTAHREGDECAQTAVTQPPGNPHVSPLPPVLTPTVLQLPELCSFLVLERNSPLLHHRKSM